MTVKTLCCLQGNCTCTHLNSPNMYSQFMIWEQGLCSVFTAPLWLSWVFVTLGRIDFFQGLYDQALEDCEKALRLNEGNNKALFRKAKSLKEMGRHQEAYEAVAKCSLAVPQVEYSHLYVYGNLFKMCWRRTHFFRQMVQMTHRLPAGTAHARWSCVSALLLVHFNDIIRGLAH